jgi:acyl-ACP thioesterase
MFPKTKEFLTKEFLVNSYLSDFKGKLSIPALFGLFQEVAWEHATLNSFGYEDLLKQGYFWALSRIKVQVNRMPLWTETFNLTTWPSGTEGLFALRDYQIRDSNGNNLVSASSSWLVVDIKTRRPQRLDTFKNVMPICTEIRATSGNAERIDLPAGSPIFSSNEVSKISDIDVNGHINNTKYVEWAVNSFPLSVYKEMNIREVDVNFLAEGFCGEKFSVNNFNLEKDGHTIVVTREQDNRNSAIIRLK